LKKAGKTGSGRIITLTTDFGTQDGYVGVMKGVICSVAPEARIVDITHEIEPGNVAQASFVLESFHTFYPEGTVNLVVVDPGVGSERRALALESAGRFYIGPDNGVFEPVLGSAAGFRCYELNERKFHLKDISRTFHGRDIFAPAAARLSGGLPLERLGKPVRDPVRQAVRARAEFKGGCLYGRVVHVDRFGNLITSITARDLDLLGSEKSELNVHLCGVEIKGIAEYYSQVGRGCLLALVGSTGRLEIAASLSSAAVILGPEAANAELTVNKTASQG
jgi:S-adenosylmethionine hydrolase